MFKFTIILIAIAPLGCQGSPPVNFGLGLATASLFLVFDYAIILEAPADDSNTIPVESYELLVLLREHAFLVLRLRIHWAFLRKRLRARIWRVIFILFQDDWLGSFGSN